MTFIWAFMFTPVRLFLLATSNWPAAPSATASPMFAPVATPLPTFEPAETLVTENFPLPLPVEDTHAETQWFNLEDIVHNFGTVYKQAPAPTVGYNYMAIIILFALILGLVFALAKMYFVVKELQVQLSIMATETTTTKQMLTSALLELEERIKDCSENQAMNEDNIAASNENIKNVKMLAEDLYSKVKIECLDAIGEQVGKCSASEAVDMLTKEMGMVVETLAVFTKDSFEEK
ncbi:hypothetical protein COEREDRAFT_12639 [Coemansia reversa NRRL 1564]|uniref:Brl1/Brr6 domain-containing protein n=1 Tax=Coemansia reversa (strain ATCC 12441 / NRRL 1564) TaxID=763665 RepID=A0A2G5B0I7_COERN|nr:hypothetical protein COEREDRAFT_12639 [Coemansia reversa NRRL 1564]|eukprot:PIA12533.1 hypothetical protein COEREDRAFT_12639 [Coemansia reversa NRRL 1564]